MLTWLQKEHASFKRNGDDLETSVDIDLKEALTGWQRIVKTIDERQISVAPATPTPPGYEVRYPELGMPKRQKAGERGDMVVKVNVKFPATLTAAQKSALKDLL